MKKKLLKLKKNKVKFNISIVYLIVLFLITAKFSHSIILLSGIETLIRIMLIGGSWVIFLYVFLVSIIRVMEKGYLKFSILLFLKLMYVFLLLFITINIDTIYGKLNKISTKETQYSSVMIANNSSKLKSYKDLKNEKIGILSSKQSIEGNIMPENFIKDKRIKNKIISYGSYMEMFEGFIDKEVDVIFVPENYSIMFKEIESLSPVIEKTKIIHTLTEKIVNKEKNVDVTKPFSLLIIGVDSEKDNIAGSTFNGDALMVLTFNPKTLNTTILSIPRDTYVPIACFSEKRKNKITHAAWYGENCVSDTIAQFLDIKIDYYLKINFRGVVKLVDALGGVEVDVPYSFCEQDSKRRFGKYTVYVKKGLQTLNGEQALALSRNRKNNKAICGLGGDSTNDFVRGQSQQLVVTAMLEKMKNVRSIDKLYEILDQISNSMETNMSTKEILSFYNIGKDIMNLSKDEKIKEILSIKRLYISGYDQHIYDYSQKTKQGTKMNLYNFVPYNNSVAEIKTALKENLGIQKVKEIKKISFDVNTPYVEKVVGKGEYKENRISLLPNFVGKDIDFVQAYATKNSLKIEIKNVEKSTKYPIGQVISQTPNSNMDILYVSTIIVEVVNKHTEEQTVVQNKPLDCYVEENKDNTSCKIPNFIGMNINTFKSDLSKYKFKVKYFIIEKEDTDYDETKSNKISNQSIKDKLLFDINDDEITITYME